jgi:hypothetical protein
MLIGCQLGSEIAPKPDRPQENLLARFAYSAERGQMVIHSDEPLPLNHRLLDEVAARRDDLLRHLALSGSDEKVHVYLFSTPERFQQHVRYQYPDLASRRAFFVETDTRLEVFAHWGDRVAEDLRHEVTHGYLHSVVPHVPLWLDEGIAEYFEVPRGQEGAHEAHLEHLARRIADGWRPDLARLDRLTVAAELEQIDYAESWAWVHFLLNTFPERRDLLQRYLQDLRKNGAAEPISSQLARISGRSTDELIEHVQKLVAGAARREDKS